MTDYHKLPRPALRWATAGDVGACWLFGPRGQVGSSGDVTLDHMMWRPAVLAEPLDLDALAEKCTNAIANCEPTDWQENYIAIRAVLEEHL